MAKADLPALEDFKAPTKLKLCLLWAATMFCYVYGDYFGLFVPGTLADMGAGRMGPLGTATPAILVAVASMMAIPSVMVILALLLPPVPNRWINIGLGAAYTAIMLMTMPGAPPFYLLLAVVEVMLTLAIVAIAWRWPRPGVAA